MSYNKRILYKKAYQWCCAVSGFKKLKLSQRSVSISARQGEKIAADNRYDYSNMSRTFH